MRLIAGSQFLQKERERDVLFVLFEIIVDYYLCSVIIEVFLRGIQSKKRYERIKHSRN